MLEVIRKLYDGGPQFAVLLGELSPIGRADEQNCIILEVVALILVLLPVPFILPEFAHDVIEVLWNDLDGPGLEDPHLLGLLEEPVHEGVGHSHGGTEGEPHQRRAANIMMNILF